MIDISPSAIGELAADLSGWGALGWEAVGITCVERFGPNSVSVLLKRQTAGLSRPADIEAGWKSDPSARFDLREWDGQHWTQNVMREGMREIDFPV